MGEANNKSSEIDLYELLEDLWKRRLTILISILVCIATSILYFQATERPQYYVTTTFIGPDDDLVEKLSFSSNNTKVFGVRSEKWLTMVAQEINNASLLNEAFNWALNESESGANWLDSTEQAVHSRDFYNNFRNRIQTVINGNELKLLFIADKPHTGREISSYIAAAAQGKALQKLQTYHLARIADYIADTNRQIAEIWYTFAILAEEPAPILQEFNPNRLANVTKELSDLQRILKEQSSRFLKEEQLQITEIIKELVSFIPPVTSAKPINTGKSRHIATSGFLGLLFGIILSIVIEGFHSRRTGDN